MKGYVQCSAVPPTVVVAFDTLVLAVGGPAQAPRVVDWIVLGDTAWADTVTTVDSVSSRGEQVHECEIWSKH